MVKVKSYIKVEDEFVPVEKFNGTVSEAMYIEGAIELQMDDVDLLTLDLWDDVNHLWAYITNGLVELTTQQEWTTYFPDQPIRLTFRADAQREQIEVEVTPSKGLVKATAPYNEFMRTMSEAGQTFFLRCMDIAPEDRELYEKFTLKLRGVVATLQ